MDASYSAARSFSHGQCGNWKIEIRIVSTESSSFRWDVRGWTDIRCILLICRLQISVCSVVPILRNLFLSYSSSASRFIAYTRVTRLQLLWVRFYFLSLNNNILRRCYSSYTAWRDLPLTLPTLRYIIISKLKVWINRWLYVFIRTSPIQSIWFFFLFLFVLFCFFIFHCVVIIILMKIKACFGYDFGFYSLGTHFIRQILG